MQNLNKLDIDRIAFIGRTFDEYASMFGLSDRLLREGPVLDCAAGPSSFTAQAADRGYDATATDLLYDLEKGTLVDKTREDIKYIFSKFDDVSHQYRWTYYKSKEDVISHRKMALDLFAKDFSDNYGSDRYRKVKLPCLPFSDNQFNLVLCSHFLFLYNDRLDLDFHVKCLKEFSRVCSGEVRIYPLFGLDALPYPHLDDVRRNLNDDKINSELVEVPFEFQAGSNKMMVLKPLHKTRSDYD